MNLKPVYSIQELAGILKIKVHEVANGLAASSVPAFYSGRQIVLSEYDCFLPGNRSPNCIYVTTDRHGNAIRQHSPSPSTVTVSTAALPQVWIDSIEKAEPATIDKRPTDVTGVAVNDRNNLLKQIAALSLLISEKSNLYKRGGKPNALQIAKGVEGIIDALPDANMKGVSGSSIRESIREGLELLTMTKQ